MKKLSFLLLVILFLFSCSDKENNGWFYNNLNGEVASINETVYFAESKFGKIIKGERESFGHYKLIFDKEGHHKERLNFNKDGSVESKLIFKIEGDNMTEINFYDEDEKLDRKMIFEYDGDEIIGSKEFDNSGALKNFSKREPEGSSFAKSESFDADGNLISRSEEKTKDGFMIEYVEYKKDGKIDYKSLYAYDENNDISKVSFISMTDDFNIIEEMEYLEYDPKGNWIKKVINEKSGPKKVVFREIEYF